MPHCPARRLQLTEYEKLSQIIPHFCNSQSAVWIGDISPAPAFQFCSFSKAVNLLGQEFELIIYDSRNALNLEALAIAGGTLKAGGLLLMIVQNRQTLPDQDSLRWSGESHAISAVNFRRFFQKINEEIFTHSAKAKLSEAARSTRLSPALNKTTAAQRKIINEILQQQADLYFLTAKRGRGKSALAGLLANELPQKIYLTAPNKSAVGILQIFAQRDLEFIAPDALYRQIREDCGQFRQHWLFVDEAAMIPLELLHGFCRTFSHILFTTTIHSYEGTGRGFKLKFMQNIHRTSRSFELTKPLRWAENDPLERFIDRLLLTDAEDQLKPIAFSQNSNVKVTALCRTDLLKHQNLLTEFYGLLMLAHYRTSPIDLRRLFDAPKQRFWLAQSHHALLGCIWAIEEGMLKDDNLISEIQRGIRRPKGNLGAQLLCFQHGLTDACRLRSLRISRIAVRPQWRRSGIGRQLIEKTAQDCRAAFDYLSVSFGYTPQLAQFWQKCGFMLVYLGDHKEASSGCYSAMALRPLNSEGEQVCQTARRQFLRDIGLQRHPLSAQFASAADWQFTEYDLISLKNFAYFHRTFNAALPAIRRFIMKYNLTGLEPFLIKKANQTQKSWLTLLRAETARHLRMRHQ